MSRPNLASRAELATFLLKHGLTPRKELGQHYLVSGRVVKRIIDACGQPGGILEIGPGPGVLTQWCEALAPTVALDVDPRAATALREAAPNCRFVLGDVLETDLLAIFRRLRRPRVVVSNLPYNIATAVVERLALLAQAYDWAVLMTQKEVAQRLLAKPGRPERGWLSVIVQSTFDGSIVCEVGPGAFMPRPKVRSTVLKLVVREKVKPISPSGKALIMGGFKQPRKTLANNLARAGYGSKSEVEATIEACSLPPSVRPHFLTEEDWFRLAQLLRIPMS